jgi:quinol-cytochrome oxidoreductase complex cytochrome b subunit
MNVFKKILPKSTFGQLSLALFMICVISGIILAIPFDINDPYTSISLFVLINPAAVLFRNMHYWSANFFLVFSLIHIWDHFSREKKIKIKPAIWFRLSIGVLVIFLAMLSGFLLKADADSMQARRILQELIDGIPLIGSFLSVSLLGSTESLQLIYVHHIATFTIFIAIIILEHTKSIWPKLKEIVIVTAIIILISWLFQAPLHDNVHPVIKGPWYFVGLQEILHWLTTPQVSILLVLLFILLIFIVPYGDKRNQFISKRSVLILTVIYLFLTTIGYFFRGPYWQWVWPGDSNYTYYINSPFKISTIKFSNNKDDVEKTVSSANVFGRKEGCIVCHDDVKGFSASHNPQALGCYSCHSGNPFTLIKTSAHKDMVLIPGNLADANKSCGVTGCHPSITDRINTGLMATLSGMISVNRFVFNEQDIPDDLTSVYQLGTTAADIHLRNLCVKCHIGNPKLETGPVTETSRGGGCLACHLNYNETSLAAFNAHVANEQDTAYLSFHPSVDLNVTNDHCFGCHSRSGRISTNYEGWHETTLTVEEVEPNTNYRIVEEHRVFRKMEADVHHTKGMDCIDCHNSYELMGDGNFYAHEEQQVNIQCSDCHFNETSNTIQNKNLDQESAIIASMRFQNLGDRELIATDKMNRPLINTFIQNDSAFLITKNSKTTKFMKAPASICSRGDAHNTLSCSSCHKGWAPSCIGCHNVYDEAEPGYDMLTNKLVDGSWVEYIGEYQAHAPALGYRIDDTLKTAIPVVPGMVLSIDIGSFTKSKHDSLIFHRLFAPAVPHTTQLKGRGCKSCHNNPVALGYGQGDLTYSIQSDEGIWTFKSKYKNNPNDGLPEDAWIGFLGERTGAVSTRTDVRPFTIEEQKNILTVGACLHCHEENSQIMLESLDDFEASVKKRSATCKLPYWNR